MMRQVRRCVLPALLCVALMTSGAASAQELPPMVDGDVQGLDLKAEEFAALNNAGLVWQETVRRIGAEYIRIRFSELSNPNAEAFSLRVLDGQGAVVWERRSEALSAGDHWTPLIYGSRALIQVHAPKVPVDVRFAVAEVAYQKSGGGWRSPIGDDDREEIVDYSNDPDISRVSRAVAKLSFIRDGEFLVCTGFMISSDRLMTNHHCVSSEEVCKTTVAVFGYQYDESGTLNHGSQYECDEVVAEDYTLDYSILRLRGEPGSLWGVLRLSDGDPVQDQEAYIVQHPWGLPKQISRIECGVSMAIADGRGPETDAAHTCDTLGGSSGSPMLALDHRVVALHHFGVGQGIFWNQNRAVRMSRIRSDAGL